MSSLLEKKGWKGLMMNYSPDKKKIWKKLMMRAWLKYLEIGWKESIRKRDHLLKSIKKTTRHSLYSQFNIKKEKVTQENVQNLFQKYKVSKYFDLLSIDIDFNDYWVWKAITDYQPRVVVIEYNSALPPTESKVVQYDPEAMWDGTNYFGASLLALEKLGSLKEYTLLGCDSMGVNAFFCKSELIGGISIKGIQDLYMPPRWGEVVNGVHVGHPPKKMIEI